MKKFLKLSVVALLLCSAAAFVSCSDDDEEDEAKAGIAQYENIRFGTAVTGKTIFKFYTVLPNNKVRYEQIKYGSYTSDVTSDYTEVKNADGTITLKLSNGVQKIKNADGSDASSGDEDITFDFSTGEDTPTLTSTYYERGEPVESTGQFTRVYSGIETLLKSTYLSAVSGKSISSSYNFNEDGTVLYKLIKYEKNYGYGNYKYTIYATKFLKSDADTNSALQYASVKLTDTNGEAISDLNTYVIHFVYAASETYNITKGTYANGGFQSSTTEQVSVTENTEPTSATAATDAGVDPAWIIVKISAENAGKIVISPVAASEDSKLTENTGTTTITLKSTSSTIQGGAATVSGTEYTLYTE